MSGSALAAGLLARLLRDVESSRNRRQRYSYGVHLREVSRLNRNQFITMEAFVQKLTFMFNATKKPRGYTGIA